MTISGPGGGPDYKQQRFSSKAVFAAKRKSEIGFEEVP